MASSNVEVTVQTKDEGRTTKVSTLAFVVRRLSFVQLLALASRGGLFERGGRKRGRIVQPGEVGLLAAIADRV